MIGIKDIEKTIKDMGALGYDVSVRDISYVLLSKEYDSESIAYKSIFGKDSDKDIIEGYAKSKKIVFLNNYVKANFKKEKEKDPKKKKSSADGNLEDITFEENKSAIIDLIQKIKQQAEIGAIEPKDALKMELDARTKLNDKFDVEKEQGQQYVIVEKKFNFICPHLHKECYVYTKEDLMEKYGLIEKTGNDE